LFAMSLMMIICCGAFAALSPMLNQKNLHGWTGTGWPEALKTTSKATWQRYNEEPNSVEDSKAKQFSSGSEGAEGMIAPKAFSPASQGIDATKSNSQRNEEICKEDAQQLSQKQATGPLNWAQAQTQAAARFRHWAQAQASIGPKHKPQPDSKLVAIPVECKISQGYKRLMKKDRQFKVWLPPEIPGSPWVWSGSALPPAMVA